MIDRFLFARLLRSQIAITLTLASVLWLVQALQLFDDLLGTQIDAFDFITLSFLIWPRMLGFTLAPALLITVLALLVRLLQDHEYFALTAAGLSPLRILRPMLLLVGLVIVLQAAISFYLAPIANKYLRERSVELQSAVVVASLQAGSFREILPNMTAYAQAQNDDGTWSQLMIHDNTQAQLQTTYVAQSGRFDMRGDGPYLVLSRGHLYTKEKGQADHSAEFGEYDLSLTPKPKAGAPEAPRFNRNHMMIHQLLDPAAHGVTEQGRIIRMKTRGLELIASLASPLIFMLISFCAILAGGLNRHGYGRRIFVAIIAALMFQISIIAVASLAARGGYDGLLLIWPLSVLCLLIILLTLQNDRALLHRLMRRERA